MSHVLLVSGALFLTSLLRLHPHFFLLIIAALAAVLVLLGARDLDQASALEVLQERHNARVHVTRRLWQDTLLRLVFFLDLGLSRGAFSGLLGVSLSGSLALTTLGSDLLLLILLSDAFAALTESLLLFLCELLTQFLLLEQEVALATLGSLLSAARVSCLPAGLEGLLAILLIRVLHQSQSLRVEHLDAPGDVLGLLACGLAFRPQMEHEECLDDIIVLDFLVRLFARAISESLVASEQEMRQVDLVFTLLRIDHVAVVKDLKQKSAVQAQLGEVLAVLL
mmetsp:Transcript_36769/g.48251  ORF Transcript_36769/g.48251 Transcript_36769/m.48251 type:complete len:281 (-) Transcript_36769:2940-3782(-)